MTTIEGSGSMTLCACGEPLHYSSAENEAKVQYLVDQFGADVKITVGVRSWMVPRHYIALHGIAAQELPTFGFPEVPPDVESRVIQLDKDVLPIWTIFAHPLDYPDGYVARQFLATKTGPQPTTNEIYETNLSALRGVMARHGLYCLGRERGDEPQIVESWI